MSKAEGEKCDSGEDKPAAQGEKSEGKDKTEKTEVSGLAEAAKRLTPGGGDLTIYLFGRTGREKEEWFRRFLLASRLKSEGRGGGLPGVCKSGESQPHPPTTTPWMIASNSQTSSIEMIPVCVSLPGHQICAISSGLAAANPLHPAHG